ncbi:MAG: FAD binding domain-containing protein [Coprococcus sp.]
MSQMLIPRTPAEACRMLAEGGRIACAGATNLYVDRQKGKYTDLDIVSLHQLDELKHIVHAEDGWHVGSLVVFDSIENTLNNSGCMAALAKAASEVGGPQIRNRGTLGGNILSASPAADTVPVMIVLDAQLVLTGTEGKRIVPINGFMKGPGKTGIHSDEILTEIIFPEKKGSACFRKVGKRNALAISVVNAAVYMEKEDRKIKDIAIALGSVGPTALRAKHAEKLLKGMQRPETEAVWQQLKQEMTKCLQSDIAPIDDIRATASYRRTVACNVIMQLVRNLWEVTEA